MDINCRLLSVIRFSYGYKGSVSDVCLISIMNCEYHCEYQLRGIAHMRRTIMPSLCVHWSHYCVLVGQRLVLTSYICSVTSKIVMDLYFSEF